MSAHSDRVHLILIKLDMDTDKREQLSKNFFRDEFACNCRCGQAHIDPRLVSLLQDVRDEFGCPLNITSAVRCPEHNKSVEGTPKSAHLSGDAADIYCDSAKLRYRLLPLLFLRFKRIGIYENFFHVDICASKKQQFLW